MSHRIPQLIVGAVVEDAIDTGTPIVALESTIISHGMPYPRNLETALDVEQAVRDAGATPLALSRRRSAGG